MNSQQKKYSMVVGIISVCLFYPFLRGNWDFPDSMPLGPFDLRMYSLFILSGIILVALFFDKEKEKFKDLKSIEIDTALIWIIVPGIIGARIYHLITDWHLYSEDIIKSIYIWNGGLGIFGGLLGGIFGAYLYSKREKINLIKGLELTAIFLPLGHALGRFGNFANQELYGGKTNLPWGQYIEATESFHHPTFLYEQIGNLILFLLMYRLYKKDSVKGDGRFVAIYFMGYGVVRFLVDIFRKEPNIISIFSPAQVVSTFLIITSALFLLKRR